MSESSSFFGRQRQKLTKRILSLFGGIADDDTGLPCWGDRFENHQQDDKFGIEMGSLAPGEASPGPFFIDEVQEMLEAVSHEDEQLMAATQLLKSEFEAIGTELDEPDWPEPWTGFSQEVCVDPQISGDLRAILSRVCTQHSPEGISSVSQNFAATAAGTCHLQDKDAEQRNLNNCAQEKEVEEATKLSSTAESFVTGQLHELQVNTGEQRRFPAAESSWSGTLEYGRRGKPSTTESTPPKIKRRASSLDDLGRLPAENLSINTDFDDLLSDAELVMTRHSDKHVSEKVMVADLPTDDHSESGARPDESKGFVPAADQSDTEVTTLSAKLKQIFTLGRKRKLNQGSGRSKPSENKALHEHLPAQRTRNRLTLPKVAAQGKERTSSNIDIDDDLTDGWCEFLDAFSSGSSDMCAWEEILRLAEEKIDSEELQNLIREENGRAAKAADSMADRAGSASENSLEESEFAAKSPREHVESAFDRGDSSGDARRVSKDFYLIRGSAIPHNYHDSAGTQTDSQSSASSRRLPSAGHLPERDVNVSMSRSYSADRVRRNRSKASRLVATRHNSAPDLRPDMLMEMEPEWLSMHDLPISDRCDMEGGYPLAYGQKDEAGAGYLWGAAAYKHYKLLMMIETKQKIQKIKDARQSIIQKYLDKQKALEHIVKVAKAYYSDPTGQNREEWKKLRKEINQSSVHSITDIRHKLSRIPDYVPHFTILLMLAQVTTLAAMCTFGGITQIGVMSQKQLKQEIKTFLGAETFHRWDTPNPWIGPPITTVLAAGATLAPCLRHDRYVREYARQEDYVKINNKSFSCCQMDGPINAAGTTTKYECKKWTNGAGRWGGPFCSKRAPGKNSIAHAIRPCCVDHRGTCEMLSHEHCSFLQGKYNPDKEHCVEVNCIRQACRIGKRLLLISSDPERPWLPASGNRLQWWRLLMSLLLTYGVLHCLPLLLIEYLLMRPLERSAGWLRIVIIYCVCGVAGQIVAGIVQPYVPHVGSTSGVAGMVGEAAVELSQAWYLLNRPQIEALKLGAFLSFLLMIGLLPYVSLYGILTGVTCGSLCALILMPYMTFDRKSKRRKVILMCVGLFILLLIYIGILFIYIQIQPRPCQACQTIDCMSFSDNMCNEWDMYG